MRDLLVGARRYSDLLAGLPGIPTNVLASRLKELEEDGLVVREARTGSGRSVLYRATARAEELRAALDALGRWGAAGMREAREGEVVTDASLVGSLRVAGRPRGYAQTTLGHDTRLSVRRTAHRWIPSCGEVSIVRLLWGHLTIGKILAKAATD